MTPLVWSERIEPGGGGWRDCIYSSGLVMLVNAGFTRFPLGIYTVAEREALERSDNKPDEQGAAMTDLQVACQRRYGVTIHSPTDSLATELTKPDRGLAIAGNNGRLPAGHKLRRWQPGFVGNHAVTVVPLGAGASRWFDPLAPMKYAGEVVTNSVILTWAFGNPHVRFLRTDELAPVVVPPPPGGDVPNLSAYIPGQIATVKPTANVRSDAKLTASIYRVVFIPETWTVTGWVTGDVDPDGGSNQWLVTWANNRWEYTAKSNVTSGPTAPASGPADCTAEVKAATDPLNAQIAMLQTDVANATVAGSRAEWDRQAAGATVAVNLLDRP